MLKTAERVMALVKPILLLVVVALPASIVANQVVKKVAKIKPLQKAKKYIDRLKKYVIILL